MLPPRTRWDTVTPHKSVLLLDERELRLYDPEARTLEIYDISGGLSRMTASPVPRLAAVREEFTVRRLEPTVLDARATPDRFLAVALTPIAEAMKEHVAEVRVLIERSLACATRVELTDADGDRTVIRFEDFRINSGLGAAELDLRVPEGTAVSRPLDGLGGSPPGHGDPR